MRCKLLFVFSLIIFTPISYANVQPPTKTVEFRLENGLKVIVREDHRAPVVVSQVWYKVGSGYEYAGESGISHALEHMMFKATTHHKKGEFSRIIAENGGKENAFTMNDTTVYFQELAKDRLPISFELEADRMRHLIVDNEEFKKEIEVVKEERRMRQDNDPQSSTYERFNAIAHIAEPYHHLTIGWMHDLENMKSTDIKNWYSSWYVPNNAILVVVGDVEPNKVFHLANEYFGKIPAGTLHPIRNQHELFSFGLRQIEVELPAKLPVIYLGYNTPSLKTAKNPKEAYALEMLSSVLDSGGSSRLTKDLIRNQQIATSVNANYELYSRFDGLFILTAIPASNQTLENLQKALLQQIKNLQTTPVPDKELQRIKAQMVAAKLYQRDSIFGQAMMIGQLESIDLSWKESDLYIKEIEKLTAHDLQMAAQKYLLKNNLTIAILKPQKFELHRQVSGNQKHVH